MQTSLQVQPSIQPPSEACHPAGQHVEDFVSHGILSMLSVKLEGWQSPQICSKGLT
jgi:hypothetical protein